MFTEPFEELSFIGIVAAKARRVNGCPVLHFLLEQILSGWIALL